MTQLNTPYPATAYLTGFLRSRGIEAVQADPALELVLKLFSRAGLARVRAELLGDAQNSLRAQKTSVGVVKRSASAGKSPARTNPGSVSQLRSTPRRASPAIQQFLARFEDYDAAVGPAIRFLQGKDPSLALRIGSRDFLPEGPSFAAVSQLEGSIEEGLAWAFGTLGTQDKAKYLASLFVDDLALVIREGIDARFELSRYGEKLAASSPTFDPLAEALVAKPTLVDEMLDEITRALLEKHQPDVVGLTAPFPGNVYGAFRMAQVIRQAHPRCKLLLGGGYVNTELRDLQDARVFDFFDFLTVDDGEQPLLALLDHLQGGRGTDGLLRTFVCEKGKVVLKSDAREHDVPQKLAGTPTYDGLPLGDYLSIFEMLNPMHRIWSDGRWNKLTLAHGCYWKKCNFCDVNLDYIGRYEASPADLLVDRMEALITETGQSGFHFVDEAAPPAVLRAMSEKLLERKVAVTWWGNVRFEKTFTPEMATLMARGGCVAVSGGLEVASDRLLKLMNKGVTVEQVARVTHALTQAGIMVHAYLMYGFPTQTEQETIDSLERVRQLFAAGCIQSAYWHRFSATAHSPIGRDPARFGIRLKPEPRVTFARNDLPFTDPTGCDHDRLGVGLKRALYNYMHGMGLDEDVRTWFEEDVPKSLVVSNLVARALRASALTG